MKLAKEWNNSGSKDKGLDLRLQNEAGYVVEKEVYVRTGGVSKNGGVADFQSRLQDLYRQPEELDKEGNFMILAKAWNVSGATHEVTKQKPQNNKLYMVEKSASPLVDDGVSNRTEACNLHTR